MGRFAFTVTVVADSKEQAESMLYRRLGDSSGADTNYDIKWSDSFEDACDVVFNHPEYVVGNVLSRQHVIDNDYDPDQLDHKLAEWASESIADVMWECVNEADNRALEDRP